MVLVLISIALASPTVFEKHQPVVVVVVMMNRSMRRLTMIYHSMTLLVPPSPPDLAHWKLWSSSFLGSLSICGGATAVGRRRRRPRRRPKIDVQILRGPATVSFSRWWWCIISVRISTLNRAKLNWECRDVCVVEWLLLNGKVLSIFLFLAVICCDAIKETVLALTTTTTTAGWCVMPLDRSID